MIRHPSYPGLLVLSFGWGLAFRSCADLIPAALNIVPLVACIGAEEALLHAQFGADSRSLLATLALNAAGFIIGDDRPGLCPIMCLLRFRFR